MSGRKLGGGRVLGSGRGLAPPAPAHHPRAVSPFAPSDSSTVSAHSRNSTPVSLSPASSSPLPDYAQDLVSNVVTGNSVPTNGSGSGVRTRLACPICEEEMVTLLQLNRHLDDAHQELPEAEQVEVKSWFDKQVLKAKRFQPLSIINQKLRGLEVFESNESNPVAVHTTPGRPLEVVDPEELVTRKHWQRPTGHDTCTDPLCDRKLGPLSGMVNCRKCGRLFCEEHTMYQMKLSRSANHEPVRGVWCRVCETCYKSREGYNDHDGFVRDHTDFFAAIRTKKVDRQRLEVQRLEKRLTKLTKLIAEAAPLDSNGNAGLLAPLARQRSQRKMLEQSVVTWEDDAAAPRCPFCKQEFRPLTFRRHHCRICGRVVCADPQTGCSTEVGLNVSKPAGPSHGTLSIDVRMCSDCKHTIFSHRDFLESIAQSPPDQRAYETLRQFEHGIRSLIPTYHRALQALQPSSHGKGDWSYKPPASQAQIQEAARLRKRLTDAFAKYDLAAKRIRNLKTDSPTQQRLQRAIYAYASSFLHENLLPLKSVPTILRTQPPNHRRLTSGANGTAHTASPLNNGESVSSNTETASIGGVSEVSSSTVAATLEHEEKEAREKLVILEEQRFMVQEMLSNARQARRFEEVSALVRNLEELDAEIEAAKRVVSGIEEKWEGLYQGFGS